MLLTYTLFQKHIQKIGVKSSIFVTIFSFSLLLTSLIGLERKNESLENLCFLGLILEFIYGIIVSFNTLKNKKKYIHLVPYLFLNWFIGCFSLNIILNVFENLPLWVYFITFLFCISNFIIYSGNKNNWYSPICYFINGVSFLLILYFAIYLIPFAPFSFIGILALGMGFYGLVPSIVSLCHTIIILKSLQNETKNKIGFSLGILLVLVGISVFAYQINSETKKMISQTATKSFQTNDDIPSYIAISQNLKPTFINEVILKKGIVYEHTTNFLEFRSLNSFGNKQYNERRIHNPIINLAYLFSVESNISADDRIAILQSNFDKRLETEEQLWSGTDLKTKNIKEDIKIYPTERLAYTEITMDIACEKDSWGQKEAIYSFQLPEGSVATSLSLWVNGIERKGVLTSKEKAEKAYKQIVAVEVRDPSLMQWREGNKVVVRIFPVSLELPRTFKCGFTTPLQFEKNKLIYQSLNIKGPHLSGAETLSRIQVVGNHKFNADKDFELQNNCYLNESKGLTAWKATFDATNSLTTNSFVWKDKTYQIVALEKETIAMPFTDIILDLNSNWTKEEVKELLNNSSKSYYVILNNEKQKITISNYASLFSQFETLHYSLLPLYNLSKNSLIVTKCGTFSANFEELTTSKYLQKLKEKTQQKSLMVINIGENINPFWQTIKEQNYVDYLKSDLKSTLKLIRENKFLKNKKTDNSVALDASNCAIQETPFTTKIKNNGSNHIFRMYAFGKVQQEQVKIQQDSLAANKFLHLAKEANIVTPITSLVVLETDADYEKNGIEKNINTLGNASINNDGSVPEPHEWALIIIGIIGLYLYSKTTNKRVV